MPANTALPTPMMPAVRTAAISLLPSRDPAMRMLILVARDPARRRGRSCTRAPGSVDHAAHRRQGGVPWLAGTPRAGVNMASRAASDGDDITSRTIVLIPARLGSTRLPDKPLASIAGEPMIVHVWRRATAAGVGPVVVACAEPAIAEAVRAAGGEAVLTDPALPSGTDRIFAALQQLDPARRFDRVVNLQGDLPTLDPSALRHVLEPLDVLGTDLATLANATTDEHDVHDPNVVKAVIAFAPRSRRCSAARSTSPAPRRPAAPARSGIISASTPSAARRWSGSPPCRRARSSCASGWSSCGRWSTA